MFLAYNSSLYTNLHSSYGLYVWRYSGRKKQPSQEQLSQENGHKKTPLQTQLLHETTDTRNNCSKKTLFQETMVVRKHCCKPQLLPT